jgi:dTDP-4-amino-4,6-dideoxygalactose transaminase
VSNLPRIPILDLRPEVEALWPALADKFKEVVFSGEFILGSEVTRFESASAEYLGVKHAIGCNSGTDALMIALRAVGVQPGDEVITSPFSFFASAESISNIGAKPIFVDVDLESMNIDPARLEESITEKTRAIMPVHLFGRPCSMMPIMAMAETHGLKVIEDSAQSFGAKFLGCGGDSDHTCSSHLIGKMTGAIGDTGCFSFYPTKNLGAYGDAGLITTNDDETAELARKLRAHGSIKRYHNELLGYNSRLDSMQAAVLNLKLPLVKGYNEARRRVATRYNELLEGVEGIIIPEVSPGHIFHQYTLRITDRDRDAIQIKLNEMGISTIIYYPIPQDRLPVYSGQYEPLENSELLAKQVISLPIWPQISDEQQVRVVEGVKAALA